MTTVRETVRPGGLLGYIRLLPVLIVVAGLVLVFRAGHFAGDVTRMVTEVQAQESDATKADETDSEAAHEPEKHTEGAREATGSDDDPLATAALAGVSRSEMTLLQDLRERRQQLDEREQQADLREQLLASTERRIDKKIAELRGIEEQLSALVASHEQRENAQIDSIVKVYETMKPKDAAQIFEKLDTDIQQEVALRMSERKMAALLAQMNPDAAKILTTLLATRSQLPDVDSLKTAQNMP